MEQTRTKTEQLEWRRNKVNELSIKGLGLTDIAKMLKIPKSTISRDIEYLRHEANENIRNHLEKRLPYEYSKTLQGIEEIIKEAWIVCISAETKQNLSNKKENIEHSIDVQRTSKNNSDNESTTINYNQVF
jgi:transposase